jgi:thiamine-monophosphate kinase
MPDLFTPVAHLGEFGLIERLSRHLDVAAPDGDLLCGIGDDAAVYRISDDLAHVVTADALIEGVHFDRSFMPWGHLGQKAIAVNVSDVVAMNARPLFAVVTIGLPRNVSVEMVDALYAGLKAACDTYSVRLVGGDTTAAPQLTLSVTVIGEAPLKSVVYRRGARPGDLLCVTGDVGAAYAGLQVLLEQRRAMKEMGENYAPDLDPYRYVIGRQLTPKARLDIVQGWQEAKVRPRAIIDVSDGVASEVHHLCDASGCGAMLRGAALPIDLETRAVADERMEDVDTFALFGGEDYELLFAVDPSDRERLDPKSFTVIGSFTEADAGVLLETPEGDVVPVTPAGYAHFGAQGDASEL